MRYRLLAPSNSADEINPVAVFEPALRAFVAGHYREVDCHGDARSGLFELLEQLLDRECVGQYARLAVESDVHVWIRSGNQRGLAALSLPLLGVHSSEEIFFACDIHGQLAGDLAGLRKVDQVRVECLHAETRRSLHQ